MSGQQMAREMAEQPARLRALLERTEEIGECVRALVERTEEVGARVRAPGPEGQRRGGGSWLRRGGTAIVARGSSDHAATYGRYLLEAATGRPVSLAAPSLITLYRVAVDYRDQLVVGVSQSGRTPEIVTTVKRLRDAGGCALAITNDPDSALAEAAGAVIELGVGDERAVPATKTVTAQFAAFAILAFALGVVPYSREELALLPGWVEEVLDDPEPAALAAEALADAAQLIVVARGFLYGAALEAALKIKETCSLLADGYSAADLRHGPIAAVTRDFPVVALSAPGPARGDVVELVAELRARGASVLTVSPDQDADMPLPAGIPEALVPIVAVVRAQQLAHALALRLGYDPDQPQGLSKVTAT